MWVMPFVWGGVGWRVVVLTLGFGCLLLNWVVWAFGSCFFGVVLISVLAEYLDLYSGLLIGLLCLVCFVCLLR